MSRTFRLTYLALLTAVSLSLFMLEGMLPIPFLAPGAKLGAVAHKHYLFAAFGKNFLYILKKSVGGNGSVVANAGKRFSVALKKGGIHLVAAGVHNGADYAFAFNKVFRKRFKS